MIDKTVRAAAFALLASTALASPAFAQSTTTETAQPPQEQVPPDPAQVPSAQAAPEATSADSNEIIVTAQKREENLQNVPISIQAIGTRRLDQLDISNFEQYTRQLPSVSYQTLQPGVTVVYMRGVASGGDGNHSGSLPSVGTYLDEQPVTTIGGTLDVHIYDIARIESLAGPQGTLYGASSEAGTIRIITNKPELGVTSGRVDGELNNVDHGGVGGRLEGMINVPIGEAAALRVVGFYQHDAGYIDNIFGTRTYCGDTIFGPDPDNPGEEIAVGCVRNGITVDNSEFVESNFNEQDIFGGRAALKIDLDDNWTVTPTVLYQHLKSDGIFAYDPNLGDLNIDRFFKDDRKDKFVQAALTVEGKIGNWDITYAGAYLDRKTDSNSDYTDYTDAYDQLYEGVGGIAYYFYFLDSAGELIDPRQRIHGTDHFKKMSQEVRIASPADKPLRMLVGAFYQRQSNDIFQDYIVDNLAPELSVNGRPGTLWLTKQERIDKDYALFGEANYDVSSQVTLTAGGRLFKYDNSLFGFFGFGRDPAFIQGAPPGTNPPPNAAGSTRTGVAGCYTVSGLTLREAQLAGADTTLILDDRISGTPCTNLANFKNGDLVPKRKKGTGFTHRLNAQYKPQDGLMFYATWSRGFRPGGINRRAEVAPYDADYLMNYELGWKTTLAGGAVRWNGAIYQQRWNKFQYSFLGANSFTEIHNGSDARIRGIESDVSYVDGGLTLNGAAAYTNAKTLSDICSQDGGASDCSDPGDFVAVPKGTRLPVTPKFKATGTARYSWPVGANKAHVQAAVTYQSSAPSTLRHAIQLVGTGEIVDPNDFMGRIRGSTLVDLFAGMDFRRFMVEGFVSNLFDKRNDLSRFVNCSSCTRTLVVPGRPRTIGLRVGAKF